MGREKCIWLGRNRRQRSCFQSLYNTSLKCLHMIKKLLDEKGNQKVTLQRKHTSKKINEEWEDMSVLLCFILCLLCRTPHKRAFKRENISSGSRNKGVVHHCGDKCDPP